MTIRYLLPAAFLLTGTAACGPDRATQERMAALEAVAAEKDSLLVLVTENARAMSEIGAAVAGVETAEGMRGLQVSSESPMAASRDSLVARVRSVTERVQSAEQRLAESRGRIRTLSARSDSLNTSVQQLNVSLAGFQVAMDAQRAALTELTNRMGALAEENVRLAEERQQLADSMVHLAVETNTIYYTIGTEQELLERGIVHKEGGSRVLFILGRRGQTLVPSRDLDPSQFIAADRRYLTEIPLPDSAEYRIASRHDVAALAVRVEDDGTIEAGALRIADADRFWQASRYLIVVRRS
jgi:uncharacterized coiled-coil protein SlyX